MSDAFWLAGIAGFLILCSFMFAFFSPIFYDCRQNVFEIGEPSLIMNQCKEPGEWYPMVQESYFEHERLPNYVFGKSCKAVGRG